MISLDSAASHERSDRALTARFGDRFVREGYHNADERGTEQTGMSSSLQALGGLSAAATDLHASLGLVFLSVCSIVCVFVFVGCVSPSPMVYRAFAFVL